MMGQAEVYSRRGRQFSFSVKTMKLECQGGNMSPAALRLSPGGRVASRCCTSRANTGSLHSVSVAYHVVDDLLAADVISSPVAAPCVRLFFAFTSPCNPFAFVSNR